MSIFFPLQDGSDKMPSTLIELQRGAMFNSDPCDISSRDETPITALQTSEPSNDREGELNSDSPFAALCPPLPTHDHVHLMIAHIIARPPSRTLAVIRERSQRDIYGSLWQR